jgi:glycosyltransferase involved in cell wall biosynthesis
MKVAIVSSGNPENLKGIMNYVQEKCKRLQSLAGDSFEPQYFLIRETHSFLLRLFLKLTGREKTIRHFSNKPTTVQIGDITYTCLWITYGILDNIITTKIRKRFLSHRYEKRFAKILSGFDVISTHTLVAHNLANYLWITKNIPYITTWHGSDINITPKQSPHLVPYMRIVMDNAYCNLFVSKALMKQAESISLQSNRKVIYTGVSDLFFRYSDEKRLALRKEFCVTNKKVVSYVGNLVPIKNVLQLPSIFKTISDIIGIGNVEFWVIGDGILSEKLNDGLLQSGVHYRMFGKLEPTSVPLYLNVSNLLMLISKNEGLGLVSLEAMRCGCRVVGSNVGGIPEVIGKENAFDLGINFVSKISKRACELLATENNKITIPACFSWDSAIKIESELYKESISIH